MLSGAHGGLLSHAGAFCPVHQCPNSSEATSWETAWETHMSASRCPAPPSPTLATKSADGTHRHAIGRSGCDLGGGEISAWVTREQQHHGAHRRGQLHQEGERSTGGVDFRERLAVTTLLATGAYYDRYIHMVGRRGRRWATLIIFSGSTSCSLRQLLPLFRADFETLIPVRFWKTLVHAKALSALHSIVILSLGPQAS